MLCGSCPTGLHDSIVGGKFGSVRDAGTASALVSAVAGPDATIIVPTPVLPTGTEPLQGVVGTPNSLDPALFDSAYGFNILNFHVGGQVIPGDGAGQTIAIVDAFGSPTIVKDVETFDAQWGIGNTDSTGQFFLTVSPLAPTVNTTPTDAGTIAGWAQEASLDVEWAHAVAPEAHVLLVEAPSPSLLDMLDANVFAAAQPGVVTVSNSWGIDNSAVNPNGLPNEPAIFDGFMVTPNGHTDSDGLQNAGVTFFAATGDTNATLQYPSTSINDIAIGGFTQAIDINGNIQNTGIWSGSGGGTNPNYVTKSQVGEFALDADPQTGVWIFDSTPDGTGASGWTVVGGTSLATPAWAAYMSIIDQGLELRGVPSLTTAAALEGNASSPGMLNLAEQSAATAADFNTFMAPLPTAYPLGGNPPPMGSPLVQIPSNHTGFGSPVSSLLTNDMVGGGITHVGDALDILSFTQEPTTTSAGQAIPTFTVQVDQPASATVDATYNGPVTVSLDPLSTAGGVLSGIVTVNAVNGIATFSGLSVLKVGNFVLDASANNTMGATSSSFQTVAAPAGQLVFVGEPISTWQFGKMPDLVVDVEDQFGNLALTNNSTVTLSIQSGPAGGTISGNTRATVSNGQVVFHWSVL